MSLIRLFNNTDKTMSESKILFKNWQHKDIKFKDLIGLGFQLPQFTLQSRGSFPAVNFFSGEFYSFEYG